MIDVIIIGAGLAGLTAARALKQSGARVLVLESRDRIGGRVQSQRLENGVTLDLGAQIIGDDHIEVRKLVDAAGLRRADIHKSGDVLHTTAGDAVRRAPPGASPLGWLDSLDALQASWRLDQATRRLGRGQVSVLDHIAADAFVRSRTFFDPAAAMLSGFIGGELCVPLAEVSAYEALDQGRAVGGLAGESRSAGWFLPDGASSLTEYLARELAGDVLLNAPAASIRQDHSGVSVSGRDKIIRARRAIIAVPPQLYRTIGFNPQLPDAWRQVFADWRPGAVVKTILVFDRPWWRSRGLSGAVIAPGEVFSAAVDTSPAPEGPGVLVVFSTASGARTLSETADECARIGQAMAWIRRRFGGEVPPPVTARSIDWSSDPHSLGGYASRRGPGGWDKAPDLFSPQGRLHFAGTETADSWRAFMEGAILSGLRAAGEVRNSA